jgi:hypothetical protein
MSLCFPSGEVQIYLWMLPCGNTVLLTIRLFDVAKFTTLTSSSLLISYKISFPIVDLKIFLSVLLHWNFLIKFSCGIWETDLIHVTVPHKSYWCIRIQNNISYQRPPGFIYIILSLINFTLLTAQLILWYTKNLVPEWLLALPFPQKNV